MFQKTQKNEKFSAYQPSDRHCADDLDNAAHQAGATVRRLYDSASHEISDAGDRVKSEISNHPIRSSAIALGVGALLALLIRR